MASVLTLRPEVVVEIGVWKGHSVIPFGLACREVGKGIVYAIDPWKASASADGQKGENFEWWSKVDHNAIYKVFIQNVNHWGLHGTINIRREKSDDVSPPDKIDILHVDGNHSEQAIRDVDRFARNVRIGGLCYMDDIDWDGPTGGVSIACRNLQGMGFLKLYDLEKGAMFQRTK